MECRTLKELQDEVKHWKTMCAKLNRMNLDLRQENKKLFDEMAAFAVKYVDAQNRLEAVEEIKKENQRLREENEELLKTSTEFIETTSEVSDGLFEAQYNKIEELKEENSKLKQELEEEQTNEEE